jgi:hypothetical protein
VAAGEWDDLLLDREVQVVGIVATIDEAYRFWVENSNVSPLSARSVGTGRLQTPTFSTFPSRPTLERPADLGRGSRPERANPVLRPCSCSRSRRSVRRRRRLPSTAARRCS